MLTTIKVPCSKSFYSSVSQERTLIFVVSLFGPYEKFELFVPWWLENRDRFRYLKMILVLI